jgi:hypothetical protein
MKDLIYKYLDKHYTFEFKNDVYNIISIDNLSVVYLPYIIREISTYFGIDYNKINEIVNMWYNENKKLKKTYELIWITK